MQKNNNKKVYIDHAAATPICMPVILAMAKNLFSYANPSAIYSSGYDAKNKLEKYRKSIAQNINANKNEIIFTGSGSESVNLALTGLVKNYHKDNAKKTNPTSLEASRGTAQINLPKVITTKIEHSATLKTLRALESDKLIDIIYLEVDEYGCINLQQLRDILNKSGEENKDNILLVTITYANSEIGTVQKVKEIGRMIDLYNKDLSVSNGMTSDTNKHKIIYHIDACQAPNYLDIDVRKLRCHMMSFNSSKIYGPKGVAALYKNSDISLTPLINGGGQEKGMRSGTENILGVSAMSAALTYADFIRNKETARMLELQAKLINKINNVIPEAVIYSPINNVNEIVNKNGAINYFNIACLPNIINVGLPGLRSDEAVIRLSAYGYEVSHKSACGSLEEEGSYVITGIGKSIKESNENIRISMGRKTSAEDIENFVKCLKEIYYKYKV